MPKNKESINKDIQELINEATEINTDIDTAKKKRTRRTSFAEDGTKLKQCVYCGISKPLECFVERKTGEPDSLYNKRVAGRSACKECSYYHTDWMKTKKETGFNLEDYKASIISANAVIKAYKEKEATPISAMQMVEIDFNNLESVIGKIEYFKGLTIAEKDVVNEKIETLISLLAEKKYKTDDIHKIINEDKSSQEIIEKLQNENENLKSELHSVKHTLPREGITKSNIIALIYCQEST